ncbi:MAG: hypothetical protein JXR94_24375, partial [Candidatus Hydrogenedentes bacterium]|nr:hypothetical protein [Candidatus Hydrogenedentota bacterium]
MSEGESLPSLQQGNAQKRDIAGELVGRCLRSVTYEQARVSLLFDGWQAVPAVGAPDFEGREHPPGGDEEGVHERLVKRIGDEVVAAGSEDDERVWLRFGDGAILHIPVSRDYLYPVQMPAGSGASFDWGPWRAFFSLTGGSILYCLSALCVVFGIGEILGPALAESYNLRETLPCIAAINVYELALLGVLLLIVVWQKVTDDAISLVVIAALFLIGSGMVLTTVANDSPSIVLAIGAVCLVLGIAKLLAMRQSIGLSITAAGFGGLAVVLAWNFGAAALLALLVTGAGVERADWLLSWLAPFAAGALILVDSVLRIGLVPEAGGESKPFLRRLPMWLIFAAVILAAAGVHEYVLAYVFDIRSGWGDYLPLLNIVLLLLLGLSLALRERPGHFDTCLAAAPLAVCLLAVAKGHVLAPASFGIELIWYPPVLLALTGAGSCWLAWRRRVPLTAYVAAAYLLGVILTAGFQPQRPLHLNWEVTGALLVAGLFAAGLMRSNPVLCFVAVVAASFGFGFTGAAGPLATLLAVHRMVLVWGITGAGALGVALIFGRKTPLALSLVGALGVAA